MNGLESIIIVGVFAIVQLLGISVACAARLCEGTPREPLVQRVFLITLLFVGVATLSSFAIGPGCWLTCSATLAFMVLTVIYNFHGGRESATW